MTEQEAELLAARLTRVWAPENETVECLRKEVWFLYNCRIRGCDFCLSISAASAAAASDARQYEGATAPLWAGVRVHIREDIEQGGRDFRVSFHTGQIQYFCTTEADREFADKWLPIFRRGGWLSGWPIEATAHEKAEWMQGFSREELEAWPLKF